MQKVILPHFTIHDIYHVCPKHPLNVGAIMFYQYGKSIEVGSECSIANITADSGHAIFIS